MEPIKKEHSGILTEIMGKVLFANYLPLLTRATAENDEGTPGYMLGEIESITFQPEPHCQQLTDYLTRRLEKPSATVKLKVLKIMFHLIHNGHVSFRHHLRKSDESIKLAASYHGPADPLLGTSTHEIVRRNAQDLLQVLFDPELFHQEEEDKDKQFEARAKVQLGGLGSAGNTTGKYEGFGSSPIEKEETIKNKVMDIFEKFINPVDETSEIIKSALTSSPGNYEAVELEQDSFKNVEPVLKKDTPDTSYKMKIHVPGRAGGGWESEEEEDGIKKSSSLNSEDPLSTDSLENLEPPSLDEVTPEMQIVTEFCGIPKLPCSLSNLHDTCKKCASLNCVAVLKAVSNLLQIHSNNDIIITRALLILEWFLRMDLVGITTITNLFSSVLTQLTESETKVGLGVQIKAEKMMLILQKLQAL